MPPCSRGAHVHGMAEIGDSAKLSEAKYVMLSEERLPGAPRLRPFSFCREGGV